MITTSNFARNGNNPNAVAISIGVPRGWKGRRYFKLAPSREMLNVSKEEFDAYFYQKLSELDAREVYNEIVEKFGENAVLLCWESPNIRCHRRMVAEWFEEELEITVPELGFERKEIKPYSEMLRKGEKPSPVKMQEELF